MRPPWTLYATPRWYMWSAASQSARWKNPECTTSAAKAVSTTSTSPPRWRTSSVRELRASAAPVPGAAVPAGGTGLVARSVTAAQPLRRRQERPVARTHARHGGVPGDLPQVDGPERGDLQAVGRTGGERDPRTPGVHRDDSVSGADLENGARARARARLDFEEPEVRRRPRHRYPTASVEAEVVLAQHVVVAVPDARSERPVDGCHGAVPGVRSELRGRGAVVHADEPVPGIERERVGVGAACETAQPGPARRERGVHPPDSFAIAQPRDALEV